MRHWWEPLRHVLHIDRDIDARGLADELERLEDLRHDVQHDREQNQDDDGERKRHAQRAADPVPEPVCPARQAAENEVFKKVQENVQNIGDE